MAAVRFHARVFVLLAVTAGSTFATPCVAATPQTAARPADAGRKRAPQALNHAETLLQMETAIGRMAVTTELVPADVRALTAALTTARGRAIADDLLKTLAMQLALAMVQGSFDDESVERLAQDLFAAVNARELSSRECGLLVLDVTTLLSGSEVDGPSTEAVANALRALSPAGADNLGGPVARPGALAILTRK